MHDSRVVAALVDRDLGLLVEQRQPQARRALEQCERRGQPEEAAADDDDVCVHAEAQRSFTVRPRITNDGLRFGAATVGR